MKRLIMEEPAKAGLFFIVIGMLIIIMMPVFINWRPDLNFMANISHSALYSIKYDCETLPSALNRFDTYEACEYMHIKFKHLVWLPLSLIGYGTYLRIFQPSSKK